MDLVCITAILWILMIVVCFNEFGLLDCTDSFLSVSTLFWALMNWMLLTLSILTFWIAHCTATTKIALATTTVAALVVSATLFRVRAATIGLLLTIATTWAPTTLTTATS